MEPEVAWPIFLPTHLCTNALLLCKPTPLIYSGLCSLNQLGIKTRLQDFHIFISLMNCELATIVMLLLYSSPATIRVNPPTWSQLAIFLGGKITHCFLRFVLPGLFMPISSLVSYSVLYYSETCLKDHLCNKTTSILRPQFSIHDFI